MANIFHIERAANKITLGTTGTTINIASHTASRLLALDASKDLEVKAIGTDVQAYHANLASLAGLTYAAAAFVKMTGANTFVLRTLQETSDDLEATIDHDNLLNFAVNEHYLQSAITTVGTIGTGVWEGSSIAVGYTDAKCTEASPDYAYISGNDAATDVTAAQLEELTDGSATTLHSHAASADVKVKVDAAATADYIGAASNDGVLRTTTGLSYADGGNFVTLGLSHLGFESLTSPTPNDRIPFWDESGSAFAWLSPSTGLSIDATSLGLNFGALTGETTPDLLDVVCIYDPTGGAHHKVQLNNLLNGDVPTNLDSGSDAMLQDHAYLAQTSGYVSAFDISLSDTSLVGYIGTTTDPAGAGTVVQNHKTEPNYSGRCIYFFVPNGKYFEIVESVGTVTILWTPLVPGGTAPIDQD